MEEIEQALLAMLAAAPLHRSLYSEPRDAECCSHCVAKRQQSELSQYLLSGCVSDPGVEWN